MRVNNTFCKIIDCFWREHCRPWQSLPNQSRCFLKSVLAFFFLLRSLLERCQIVTDTCKKPLNHLFYYANENVSEEHLSLICITSILTTRSKIIQFVEDLAVFTALNHSGFLGKNFVKLKKKIKFVKLKMLPSAHGLGQQFQDLGHSFSP